MFTVRPSPLHSIVLLLFHFTMSLVTLYMRKDELPAILSWTYYNDGTSDPPPLPKPEPSQEPKEPPKYDYDKLIAESTRLYSIWWKMWKRIHPEWALFPEEPKEPVIKPTPKPRPTFKPLTCKRCNRTWTPRSEEPPVQCPKCHSAYWNREKVKH